MILIFLRLIMALISRLRRYFLLDSIYRRFENLKEQLGPFLVQNSYILTKYLLFIIFIWPCILYQETEFSVMSSLKKLNFSIQALKLFIN